MSRTMARPRTGPTQAAIPCRTRPAISMPIEGARTHHGEAARSRLSPASSVAADPAVGERPEGDPADGEAGKETREREIDLRLGRREVVNNSQQGRHIDGCGEM